MTTATQAKRRRIDDAFLSGVRENLAANRPVRKRIAGSGELRVERQLPFLFVYRRPASREDPGTASLLRGESSYLIAPASGEGVKELVGTLCDEILARFGSVFVVEIWTSADGPSDLTGGPRFRVVCEPGFQDHSTMHRLVNALRRVRISDQAAQVSFDVSASVAPLHAAPLVPAADAERAHVHCVGIEIDPIHQDPETGAELPIARRSLQRQLARVLREAAFEFARRETPMRPRHYQALGRRALTKLVWNADAALAAIARQFDLLLMVTPINTQAAFAEFEASGFEKTPKFFYRRRTIDPPLLKRELYRIPIEKIDDPTMAFLFEEKRRELGLKLTLVEERETPRFLPTGIALFGRVDAELLARATRILDETPKRGTAGGAAGPIDARAFAARAEEMLGRLRSSNPDITSRVEMRDELTSLTVSEGNLLVGSQMTFPADRVEALLYHEVGTHVVTHWNGSAQPLELLEVGLAGHDALQEGLAVFSEYLVGGLTSPRLRTLAIRVVAAQLRVEGASFVETFRELRDRYGFSANAAFLDTNRVFRGGGLVKDAVYLRGLQAVLDYVAQGEPLEFLFVGKISIGDVPILRELKSRKILKAPALRPPCLDRPDALARLERARQGMAVGDLLVAEAVESDSS